jgi:hypothetical protein
MNEAGCLLLDVRFPQNCVEKVGLPERHETSFQNTIPTWNFDSGNRVAGFNSIRSAQQKSGH